MNLACLKDAQLVEKRFDEVKAHPYRVTCALIAAISVIGVGKLVYDAHQNRSHFFIQNKSAVVELIEKSFAALDVPPIYNTEEQYFLAEEQDKACNSSVGPVLGLLVDTHHDKLQGILDDIAYGESDGISLEAKESLAPLQKNLACLRNCPTQVQNNHEFHNALCQHNAEMECLLKTSAGLEKLLKDLSYVNCNTPLVDKMFIIKDINELLQGNSELTNENAHFVKLDDLSSTFEKVMRILDQVVEKYLANSQEQPYVLASLPDSGYSQLESEVSSTVSIILEHAEELITTITEIVRQKEEAFMETYGLTKEMLECQFIDRKKMYEDVNIYLFYRYSAAQQDIM